MPLDPSIILGAKTPQFDLAQFSPVNTLMTAMKFKQLDQEGELNALTLKERKGLQTFLAENPDLTQPETRYKLATQFGETGRKLSTGVTEIGKAATEEAKRRNEMVVSKTGLYRDALRDVTDQRGALKWLQTQQQDPDMAGSPVTKVSIMDAARAIPADPEGFADWKNKAALGLSEYIKQNKPVTFAQDLGPTGRVLSRPGLGGPATLVPGSEYTKGKTFADLTAERQASTSAGQLGLAQAKFKFEQANPTMSIQEDPSGLLAVNTRTGVATPVVYGPMGIQAAPAAAPTAAPAAGPSVMRQQGAGMPGERVSAIPGMTSVLDRNVAPAAMPMPAEGGARVAGAPVAGKEKPMTETQSNATAYGMRMKEANAILDDLSKKGVLKGAVIEATPLIGGALGQALPSVLGGTSAAQQQVNQAKSNFITAVLRKESGAVISDSEFDREDKKYFPQINDNAEVIKQKENARKLAIKAIEVQAGPGAKEIQKYQPSAGGLPGASANDPLGLRNR